MFIIGLSQSLIIGLFALICLYVQDEVAASSVIFGGLVYCVPYWLTSLYLHKPGADTATKVMIKAYVGFVYKLIVSVCLFIYFFKYKQIHFLTFFAGYIMALLIQYIVSFGLNKRNKQDI